MQTINLTLAEITGMTLEPGEDWVVAHARRLLSRRNDIWGRFTIPAAQEIAQPVHSDRSPGRSAAK